MKRILAFLTAVMLCFILVSCGDDKTESTSTSTKSASDDYDKQQEAIDNWREQSKKMDKLIAEYKSQN